MNDRVRSILPRPQGGTVSSERIAVLVDGSNVYATTKAIGLEIDYKLFIDYYRAQGKLLRISYYTALLEEPNITQSIKPLIDWLDYNSFDVVSKVAKKFTNEHTGVVKIKGNMDIEIATDAMSLAASGRVDHIILYTGDGDFTYLVEKLKMSPVRVTVVSTITTQPPMCADELRRSADEFIDLFNMREHFLKERGHARRESTGR